MGSLDGLVRTFDWKASFPRVVDILRLDPAEQEREAHLQTLISDLRQKIIVIVGPYGAGKSVLSSKMVGPHVVKVGEFAGYLRKNPYFFDLDIFKGKTLVCEAHPVFLMLDYRGALGIDPYLIERPFLADDLVGEILREGMKVPFEMVPSFVELIAGSTESIFRLGHRLSSTRFSLDYDEQEHGLSQGLVSSLRIDSNFIPKSVANYDTQHKAGAFLRRVHFGEATPEEIAEHLPLMVRMGFVVENDSGVRLRSPLIRSLFDSNGQSAYVHPLSSDSEASGGGDTVVYVHV
ncbi:MAG: hypothetical protein WC777_04130 [Candidatus Gracilibacteria bacterium]|jgi:hypothetical protein